jgi:hypothetical protein
MSRGYSNPKRASDPHALPDVETFQSRYGYCKHCGSLNMPIDGRARATWRHCEDCTRVALINQQGWFWWTCSPGCLPDSEPFGPFDTEADALADAQSSSDDDDEDEPADDEAIDSDEPDEDSITTSDHETFYQYGKQVLVKQSSGHWFAPRWGSYVNVKDLDDHCEALRAYMDREQFWPDVWFVSDHGNAHRIDLSGGSK